MAKEIDEQVKGLKETALQWSKLQTVQQLPEYEIIKEVLDSLINEFAQDQLNKSDFSDDGLKNLIHLNGKVKGVQAVIDRLNTIEKSGKSAIESLDLIEKNG